MLCVFEHIYLNCWRKMNYSGTVKYTQTTPLWDRLNILPSYPPGPAADHKKALGDMLNSIDQKTSDTTRCHGLMLNSVNTGCPVLATNDRLEKVIESIQAEREAEKRERKIRQVTADVVNGFEKPFFDDYYAKHEISRFTFLGLLDRERCAVDLSLGEAWNKEDPKVVNRAYQDLLKNEEHHGELLMYYQKYFSGGDSNVEGWRVYFDLRQIVAMRNEESHVGFSRTNDQQKFAQIQIYRQLEQGNELLKRLLDAVELQVGARIQSSSQASN